MDSVVAVLLEGGYSVRLVSFSALDRFCGLRPGPARFLETDADLASLSRLFDGLRFPGSVLADAAVDCPADQGGRHTWYFRCLEDDETAAQPYRIQGFAWDARRGAYQDPDGLYQAARTLRETPTEGRGGTSWLGEEDPDPRFGRWKAAADAALILSRYRTGEEDAASAAARVERLREGPRLSGEEQRVLLSSLMVSRSPQKGLSLLKRTGFLSAHWPALAAMDDVDHSKEFHPEGNAWEHTLETFRYRKVPDLVLSLGLLLHDCGKPLAEAVRGRRFDHHAELGAAAARRFLDSLGYEEEVKVGVEFLVRNHMMPAALPRLPLNRVQATLESPLFPLLLELYRCDESSSFKGPEGFYESSSAYRAYLRNVKNPYRSADGKKLMRRLFSRP